MNQDYYYQTDAVWGMFTSAVSNLESKSSVRDMACGSTASLQGSFEPNPGLVSVKSRNVAPLIGSEMTSSLP